MDRPVKEEQGFRYVEAGDGEVLLLLHGLFGSLCNWHATITYFAGRYRVIIPMLPIYELPIKQTHLEGLVDFLISFLQFKEISSVTVVGNSLGGHIALLYALQCPGHVVRIVLTGSSGLFERSLSNAFPQRSNYAYTTEMVNYTLFNPTILTKEDVDEVFYSINNRSRVTRLILLAKSVQRRNLVELLPTITIPTLLIWGLNDTITPPSVAHEFQKLLPQATLRFIDQCCHAPMMEQAEKFNHLLDQFLQTPMLVR